MLNQNFNIKERLEALHCVVLIPTYNNAGTLLQVIDAVHQYTDDIMVVNDGSTDNTAALLPLNPTCTLSVMHAIVARAMR